MEGLCVKLWRCIIGVTPKKNFEGCEGLCRLDMGMGGLDFSYRLKKIEAPYIKSSS